MLINLTPHPMHIYPVNTPDRIEPGTVAATQVIYPSTDYPTVRLGQTLLGEETLGDGMIVTRIAFGEATHLTPAPSSPIGALPDPADNTWYIVSTPVALASPHRSDLLVPYGHVRDLDGNVIGSRGFARPCTRLWTTSAPNDLRAKLVALHRRFATVLDEEVTDRRLFLDELLSRLLDLALSESEVAT
jgi:hypothetical protein